MPRPCWRRKLWSARILCTATLGIGQTRMSSRRRDGPVAPGTRPTCLSAGAHTLASGAGLAMGLVEQILTVLTRDYQFSLVPLGTAPQIGPALAPPRSTLLLDKRAHNAGERR
jgi:hypothetical protein